MKIIYRNLKQGLVKVGIENFDDLWYLSLVVKEGDLVKARSKRRIKSKEDLLREKSSKESVTLKIEVENLDFSQEGILRISGKIQEGPEDLVSLGSYHTFKIKEGSILKIIKEKWLSSELQRLREAEEASLRARTLILVIEEGEASLALLHQSKINYFDLSKSIGGKYASLEERGKRKEEFYKEIEEFILRVIEKENVSAIIISGPGFEPENFHKFFLGKHPKLKGKTFLEKISSGGRGGIKEVVKRPLMKKISQELGSAREIQEVNKLLKEIGKDTGLGVYGLVDVEGAIKIGSVESLLVSDDFFLKNRGKVDEMIREVRQQGGKFHFINHEGEAGQQLNSLGGIGAILRFRI